MNKTYFKLKKDAQKVVNRIRNNGWPQACVISFYCDVPTKRKIRYAIQLEEGKFADIFGGRLY